MLEMNKIAFNQQLASSEMRTLNVETLNSLTYNNTQHVHQDEEFIFPQVRHHFFSSDAL